MKEKSMLRTAVVYFDDTISRAAAERGTFAFGSDFFENPNFPARPNSTLRLTLVNLAALEELAIDAPVSIFHYSEVLSRLHSLLSYDQVVVNTVAAKKVVEFVNRLLPVIEGAPDAPRLIIGTEYSWTNNVKTGNISQEVVDSVYLNHLMLRHTARTDRHLYDDPRYRNSRVQEFELGIDTDAMPRSPDITDRDEILFVAAPEGRVTKNNDEISEVVDILESHDDLGGLRIRVLQPPYTTLDYWKALTSARFLVFTSKGETFSYVLNDALAMGVVAFRRPELFATKASRFGVDSYWDVGLRYSSASDVVGQMLELSQDPARLRAEARKAKSIARRWFSKDSVRENWRRVLSDQSLNVESMFITDVSTLSGGVNEAFERARDFGCRIVMSYMSRGLNDAGVSSYSLTSCDRSQVLLPYCYVETGGSVRQIGPGMSFGIRVAEADSETVLDYLRMVIRANRVRNIVLDAGLDDDTLNDAVRNLRVLDGARFVPVSFQAL